MLFEKEMGKGNADNSKANALNYNNESSLAKNFIRESIVNSVWQVS